MQRTRGEALAEFLSLVTERGDPLAEARARNLLDRVLETMWQATSWVDFQSPTPLQLTLTPGQASYALPDYYGRPGLGAVRNLTRGGVLTLQTQIDLDREEPLNGTAQAPQGPPHTYVLGGIVGVFAQPAAGGEALSLVSTDPADTDVVVSVEGDDLQGRQTRERVTLTGQVPVQAGTWRYLDALGKTCATLIDGRTSRGTVTATTASGRTIQVLYDDESAKEHRLITFFPVPHQADTIAVPVMRRLRRLRHDADVLPGDWWPAIIAGMLLAWDRPMASLGSMMWPELVRLIENNSLMQPRLRVRPYGGR